MWREEECEGGEMSEIGWEEEADLLGLVETLRSWTEKPWRLRDQMLNLGMLILNMFLELAGTGDMIIGRERKGKEWRVETENKGREVDPGIEVGAGAAAGTETGKWEEEIFWEEEDSGAAVTSEDEEGLEAVGISEDVEISVEEEALGEEGDSEMILDKNSIQKEEIEILLIGNTTSIRQMKNPRAPLTSQTYKYQKTNGASSIYLT